MRLKRYSLLLIIPVLLCFVMPGFTVLPEPTPYAFPELKGFPTMPINNANPVTVQGVELGRYLFYDSLLSKDYTVSCATCHKQEFAFSDSPNVLSMGISGPPVQRNSPALFNLAWYPAMFWDGKAGTIEAQVFHPVRQENEMGLTWKLAVKRINKSKFYKQKFAAAFGPVPIDSILISKALGQFMRTLISYNNKLDKAVRHEAYFTPGEYRGFVLMNDQTKGDCLHCHTTDANSMGSTFSFSNNGLDTAGVYTNYSDKGLGGITGKPEDYGRFKIPSLRNIAVTAPYMHDGRFSTLEEVLDFYSDGIKHSVNIDSKMTAAHKGGVHLTPDEKHDIIAFLKALTDSTFITNPAFSNPLKK